VDKLSDKRWDAFICHASEDKSDVARPLAELLKNKGFEIWYDDFTLKLGDSLSRSINTGLANSRYGIVVISTNFFLKDWPQKELEGLVAREINGKTVILPVWHEITREKILEYCPIIADKLAANTKNGLDCVARKIIEVIGTFPPDPLPPLPDTNAIDQLIQTLRDGYDRERNKAARRLGEYNQPRVVDALLAAVKYDSKVRYEALHSLFELRSKEAKDNFIERLEDPSSRIRHISILALGEIGDSSTIDSLQKIVDTHDFNFFNKKRPGGKGQRTNWGKSENVVMAKEAIHSIQKREGISRPESKPSSLDAEDFKKILQNLLDDEGYKKKYHIDVNAGYLHRITGGYPQSDHRMPVCCNVMYSMMQKNDRVLHSPPKGKGASLVIRYYFPRDRIRVKRISRS